VKQEREAREELSQNFEFEDRIYRNYGIMKSARILKTEEFLNGLSLVRLGTALGYFDTSYATVGEMLHTLQNASLATDTGKELSDETLGKLRAQIVREKL
jgi:protein arginine kinase